MNSIRKVTRIFKSVFYFGTLLKVLNKLIIFLSYYFMFKDQIIFLESSHVPTSISIANANMYLKNALYQIFQGILK